MTETAYVPADAPVNLTDRLDVILNDERLPILYDSKGQPLIRPVGFRSR